MEFSGQNPGVGSLSLLQGTFPTQGLNPGLPHCRGILYQLSHQGSQRLEWPACPFSRGVFPTQESNLGLLHCRGILYQLSYQGMWGISEIQASDASGEEAGFGVTGTSDPPQADWVTSGIP